MKPAAFIPREIAERKPPHGAACTRCGMCYMITLCGLARHVFKNPMGLGRCPVLEFDSSGDAICAVMADPARFDAANTAKHGEAEMREAAALLIGAGYGCDTRVNGEPRNDAFNAKLDELDKQQAAEIKAAELKWQWERVQDLPF